MVDIYTSRGTRQLRFAALAAFVVFAAACGDDDGGTAATAGTSLDDLVGASSGSSEQTNIDIGGTPPSKLYNGTEFSFMPTVENPDGLGLTFSASNLPDWASIDRATGQVSGTPRQRDIGTYENIRIMVSGGGRLVTSAPFSVEVMSNAIGTAKLSWQAPTQNTNGRPLTDLAGYKVYWGRSPSDLTSSTTVNGSDATTYTVQELRPATWYFATSAYNSDGIEGPLSQVVSKTIRLSDQT